MLTIMPSLLPTMLDYTDVSFQEYDSLNDLEKAVFACFLSAAYDTPEGWKFAWAPENSGQIIEAFNTVFSNVPRWVILVNQEFAGFWVAKSHALDTYAVGTFIAPAFRGGVVNRLCKELARRVAIHMNVDFISAINVNNVRSWKAMAKLFSDDHRLEVFEEENNRTVYLYNYRNMNQACAGEHIDVCEKQMIETYARFFVPALA